MQCFQSEHAAIVVWPATQSDSLRSSTGSPQPVRTLAGIKQCGDSFAVFSSCSGSHRYRKPRWFPSLFLSLCVRLSVFVWAIFLEALERKAVMDFSAGSATPLVEDQLCFVSLFLCPIASRCSMDRTGIVLSALAYGLLVFCFGLKTRDR
jgi:hypothetical protein